jgi:hypothetical protein
VPAVSEENPAVPKEGQSILIGVQGISPNWIHFGDDTPKARDHALSWLTGPNVGPRRLFRVSFGEVSELEVQPPVPAKLIVRQKPEEV